MVELKLLIVILFDENYCYFYFFYVIMDFYGLKFLIFYVLFF